MQRTKSQTPNSFSKQDRISSACGRSPLERNLKRLALFFLAIAALITGPASAQHYAYESGLADATHPSLDAAETTLIEQYDSYGPGLSTDDLLQEPNGVSAEEVVEILVLDLEEDSLDEQAGYPADVLDLARNKFEWYFEWTEDGRHKLSLDFFDETGAISQASIVVGGESGESLELLAPTCMLAPCLETPAIKIMRAVAANAGVRVSTAFTSNTRKIDWLDCMTACMEDNDPIDKAIEAAIGYLLAGQLPKTLVASIAEALGDHQLATRIRNSLRNPAVSRFTTFPRSLQAAMRAGGKTALKKVAQVAGRYVGPVFVAYGLYLAAIEFHCAGVCSACWWYGVPYDSSMRMSESFESYFK